MTICDHITLADIPRMPMGQLAALPGNPERDAATLSGAA
jgi:hypothetical protein